MSSSALTPRSLAIQSTESRVLNEMDSRAQHWMQVHEEVMRLFEHLAAQMAFRGRRFGIGHLTEVVRWEYGRMHPQHSGIKVCNSYRAYIARELIRRNPLLADYLVLRPIRLTA